jgi:hypothetical protein
MKVLKVGMQGDIKPLNRTKVRLTPLLGGEPVGLLESKEHIYQTSTAA